MEHLKLLHQYLKEKRPLAEIPSGGYPFITIARQAGAGGHLLAHVILTDMLQRRDEELFSGWHVFDRELCEVVAADPAIRASLEELLSERYRSEFRNFVESLFAGRSDQDEALRKTFEIVRILARLGKVIIVGRCGMCVTRDLAGGVHLRLVAPESDRVGWMMHKLNVGKEEARLDVERQEHERHRLIRTYFNRDPDDPLLYDASWNTARVHPHEISRAVIELLAVRAQRRDPAPARR